MEIPAYLNFCPPDSLFFDVPSHDGGRFDRSDAQPPVGWTRRTDAEWVNVLPPEPLPDQGWKVHVSATPENAEAILRICWDHCTSEGLGFKFLKSREVVFLRSGKYADRGASGKFVTIYPRDDAELTEVLHELGPQLEGFEGPAILSDLRWRKGPLYVRYGGFRLRAVRTETGEQVWGVERPDGTLVPDERRPGFHPPEWAELPEVLQQALEERGRGRLTNFPYRPRSALHFSNGGGVYRGVDADGREVLLKEARPLAGLDGSGADAVARLERERWACETMAGLGIVPELFDHRIGHEHYFLVREFVEGEQLNLLALRKNPLLRAGSGPEEFQEFREWVLATVDRLEQMLAQMHAQGISFGDLHPGNVLVREDDSLCFIDLEAALPIDVDEPQALGAPGYIAPPNFRGEEIDHYGLAVMMLDLFVPMVRMINWEDGKAVSVLRLIEERFGTGEDYRRRVLAGLQPEKTRAAIQSENLAPLSTLSDLSGPVDWPEGRGGEPEEWRRLVAAMVGGLLSAASPDRSDRLYPGDPVQLVEPNGGLTFCYGAAGVLWTLVTTGHQVPASHRDWFLDAVRAATWERPGFGDGAAGVALALHELGEHAQARTLALRAAELVDEWTPRGLLTGRAGVVLTLHRVGDPDDPAVARALDRVGRPFLSDDSGPGPRPPGLTDGWSGDALACVRSFERTGDEQWLDRAEACLWRDLEALDWRPGDGLSDSVAFAPFLGRGAGGTALAADALLAHREAPGLEEFREVAVAATDVPQCVEVGLLEGHAGLALVARLLAGTTGSAAAAGVGTGTAGPDVTSVLVRHARAMRLHTVGFRGDPLPTGRYNLRLSTDFGTGAAGVVLALSALSDPDRHVRLPLI